MEYLEDFEYYFLKNGKYQKGIFKEKTTSLNTGRFRDFKFKKIETLNSCFKRNGLLGYPSNTGVNGWARQTIEINFLNIVWVSNFSYEDTSEAFTPRVEIIFKKKPIKIYKNIDTTKKFIEILNHFLNPTNVIELIEQKYGIEKCYQYYLNK